MRPPNHGAGYLAGRLRASCHHSCQFFLLNHWCRAKDGHKDVHCEKVKNLTVSLDDETYRRARIVAAERETSISSLVKKYLIELTAEGDSERLKRLEREVRIRITNFDSSDQVSRDVLHKRDA